MMNGLIEYLRQLNIWSMMLRIILAMIMGGMIGIERERKGRAAGFRTYMLVAMGAAITMILSQYLHLLVWGDWIEITKEIGGKTDVSRFGARVINGVGFLAAGTILVTGWDVKGLTTAAGLWASACMGLAVGAGFYECMLVAAALIFLCMRLMPWLEERMISLSRNMGVRIELDSLEYMGDITSRLKNKGIQLYEVEIDKSRSNHLGNYDVMLSIGLPKKLQHAEVLSMLSVLDGIAAIDEA